MKSIIALSVLGSASAFVAPGHSSAATQLFAASPSMETPEIEEPPKKVYFFRRDEPDLHLEEEYVLDTGTEVDVCRAGMQGERKHKRNLPDQSLIVRGP